MKATKKLLSILLILALCMSLMSVTAFAANDQGSDGEKKIDPSKLYTDAEATRVAEEGGNNPSKGSGSSDNKSTEDKKESTITVWNQTDLVKAIAEAELDQTIVFGEEIHVTGTLVVDRPVTINFAGNSLVVTPNAGDYAAVSVLGAATLKNGTISVKPLVVSENEVHSFSVVLSADSSSSLKELWLDASGISMLSGGAADVYNVDADNGNKLVVAPKTEEEAEKAEASAQVAEGEGQSAASEDQPAASEDQPAASEDQPAASEDQPAASEEQPAASEEQPAADEEQPDEGEDPEKKGVIDTVKDWLGIEPAEEAGTYVPEDAVPIAPAEELSDETPEEPPVTPSPVQEEPDAVDPFTVEQGDFTVEGDSESFDVDVDLVAEVITAGDAAYAKAISAVEAFAEADEENDYEVLKVVDVSFVAEDGQEQEPSNNMTVTVAVENLPDDADAIKVLHINADGSASPVRTSVNSDGSVTFVSDVFSPFAITAARSKTAASVKEGKTAETSDNPYAITDGKGYASVKDALQGRNGTVTVYVAKDSKENVTIPAGVTVILAGGYGHKLGNITVNGYLTLEQDLHVGNIQVNAGADLVIKDSSVTAGNINVAAGSGSNVAMVQISTGSFGTLSFEGSSRSEVVGRVTGGSYTNYNSNAKYLLEEEYVWSPKQANGTYTPMRIAASVKSDDGKAVLNYYKGEAQAKRNSDFSFTIIPSKLVEVRVGTIYEEITLSPADYNYNASRGNVTISGNAAFLETLPAGENRFSFTLEDEDGDQAVVTIPLKVWANVTYNPSQHIIGSEEDVIFKLSTHESGGGLENDMPLQIVLDKEKTLVSGKDYIIGPKGEVIAKSDWLDSLEPGNHVFDFVYPMGTDTYRLSCTVNVSADYRVVKINDVDISSLGDKAKVDWYTNSGKTLTLRVDGDPYKFAGVRVDGRTVSSSYYYAYGSGNEVTVVELRPGILNTLGSGVHTATVVFSDGEASANFTVHNGSASPKTGDENSLGLWVAVMALSGAAVVALIPKKKKQ